MPDTLTTPCATQYTSPADFDTLAQSLSMLEDAHQRWCVRLHRRACDDTASPPLTSRELHQASRALWRLCCVRKTLCQLLERRPTLLPDDIRQMQRETTQLKKATDLLRQLFDLAQEMKANNTEDQEICDKLDAFLVRLYPGAPETPSFLSALTIPDPPSTSSSQSSSSTPDPSQSEMNQSAIRNSQSAIEKSEIRNPKLTPPSLSPRSRLPSAPARLFPTTRPTSAASWAGPPKASRARPTRPSSRSPPASLEPPAPANAPHPPAASPIASDNPNLDELDALLFSEYQILPPPKSAIHPPSTRNRKRRR